MHLQSACQSTKKGTKIRVVVLDASYRYVCTYTNGYVCTKVVMPKKGTKKWVVVVDDTLVLPDDI